MRRLSIGLAAAATMAYIAPVGAQVAPWPPAAVRYPFPAPTPEDAYRQGIINRFELEHFEGLLPQALQGPSVDGSRGGGGGERR
jgi:hypothetical protein